MQGLDARAGGDVDVRAGGDGGEQGVDVREGGDADARTGGDVGDGIGDTARLTLASSGRGT